MQFYWKPNRRPGVETQEGDSEILAQFLAVEIGLSKAWTADIMSELRADPELEWIGNVMRFTRQGDTVLISDQYDEKTPPEAVALAVFVAALNEWDAYVREGVSNARHSFPMASG